MFGIMNITEVMGLNKKTKRDRLNCFGEYSPESKECSLCKMESESKYLQCKDEMMNKIERRR